MSKPNIVVLRDSDKPYIIRDMMVTSLSAKEFAKVKELNSDRFGDWDFVPYAETDFGWWHKISKKLTRTRVYHGVYFHCNYYGDITEQVY